MDELYIVDDKGFLIEVKWGKITNDSITTPPPMGMYKPRWNGVGWEDGGTKPLTENEMIMLAIADLADIVLGGME